MPGSTTNYAFNLPLVNDPIDSDLWGGQLNANWTSLDALLAAAGLKSTGFDDSAFRISDNADVTKKLAFEVSGITTGTTRTLTVADTSLAIPANSTSPSSLILAEDTDNGTNTVQIIAPAAVTSNRVLTLPDETGTVVTTARTASDTQTGIVELATTAETQTGTDTGRAITPAGLAGAIGVSAYYESAATSFTAAGGGTFSHGLGRRPRIVQAYYQCVSAEGNYSVNDEVLAAGNGDNNTNIGVNVWTRSTNEVLWRIGSGGVVLNNATTGTQFLITPANWRLIVRAWA